MSCSIHKSTSPETLSQGHVSKDCDTAQAQVSLRWNPTPDQVELLKHMFRHGTRSPTAEHIQQITALLRRFGRVEGKNVFYWFQNHKARERQRQRREKCHITERKKSGVRRACCEGEEKSKLGGVSNLDQGHVSFHTTKTMSLSSSSSSTPTTQLIANIRDHGNQQHRQYQMLELFPLGNGSEKQSSQESTILSLSKGQH